ncbi:hypothetical protein SLS58_005322 [Diplodia intermedia]|uniref:Zn(2)-C6 fungal-type domain-containing protein n=1 Tax=Diplodia intermedia TaxID=856260 RepID=A0ABR3TQS8_9PEZI
MSTSPKSTTKADSPPAAATRSRQQAGLACDECRRRKLRCDRGQPSCGVCRESGAVCNRTTARQPRGPKKGHLRALQSRIVALERRLSDQDLGDHVLDDALADDFMSFPDENDCSTGPIQTLDDLLAQNMHSFSQRNAMESGSCSSSAVELTTPPFAGISPVDCISDLMRADLGADSKTPNTWLTDGRDHLYFDRVHTFCPILSKRHYFSRARNPRPNEVDGFACLQNAMWTLAVAMSSQFQYLQDDLYAYTRLTLENLELDPMQADCLQIEKVQAWALLAVYEFMRVGYQRGWMSAGKCFRLAVLMKLHCIDGPDGLAAKHSTALSWAEVEERRRTFWMAYTIDRFLSLLDHLPLTFDQHVIMTRLPAPEKEFQSDEAVLMDFLSEYQPKGHSTFMEFIRLVALCGQSLSHQQQGIVEHTYGCFSLEFWDRHQRLDARLTQSIESMSLYDPCAVVYMDSMPLFTHMAAHAAVLMLYKAGQTAPWGLEDYQGALSEHEGRALAAAQQMIKLSKSLIQLSHFKVHPFMPVLLYFCGDFFRYNSHLDPTFEMQAVLHEALRGLVHVNKIAQDCLSRLELHVLSEP